MKITLVKRVDLEAEYTCSQCYFEGACMQTNDMPAPFGIYHCGEGEYWEIEE